MSSQHLDFAHLTLSYPLSLRLELSRNIYGGVYIDPLRLDGDCLVAYFMVRIMP